jgi:hypothetical protein
VIWVACIPLTVNDGTWADYFRTTALQFVPGNGSTVSSGKVRVSSADTTPDYLSSKITAGTGIIINTLNPGANEELEIEVDSSVLTFALDDLTDVIITAPADKDELYYDSGTSKWVNGKITVLKTGDNMTGTLSITSTEPSIVILSSYTAIALDASAHQGALATNSVNQNGNSMTSLLASVGLRGLAAITGASGTATGAAGMSGQAVKSGGGTLTWGVALHAETNTKSAGTLTNSVGVYIAAQTAGTNNYGIYQAGAGLNRLNDQMSIIGSADRIQEIIRANATQTASLVEWQDSAGNVYASVTGAGIIQAGRIGTDGEMRIQASGGVIYRMFGNGSQLAFDTVAGGGIFRFRKGGAVSGSTVNVEILQVTTLSTQGNGRIFMNTSESAGNVWATVGMHANAIPASYSLIISNPASQTGLTPLALRAIASQTGDLQKWQASGGTDLLAVAVGGHLTFADAVNIIVGTTTGTKIGTGTTQKLSLWNKTPIVQPTALTTQLTTLTHTAPGVDDFAVQDFVDVSLGAGWAFANHDEANTVLKAIANLQTRFSELETRLSNFGFLP